MGKVIINEDIWDLIEDLNQKEKLSLICCLTAYSREEEANPISRLVFSTFKRIVIDSERETHDPKSELSEKRRQAALKRWSKQADANGMQNCMQNGIQTDAKVMQNNAKMQNAFAYQEERESSKEKEDNSHIYTPIFKDSSLQTTKFNKPTVEEVKAYAAEKGYTNFNPEQFWNFYESKDWMVGKNKMANWRSAVSGWALRDKNKLAESAKPQTDYKAQLSKLDYGALLRK